MMLRTEDRPGTLVSTHLGEIDWEPGSELLLPVGLPGFEDERRMIAVEVPAQRPLVFLQSVEKPDICFVSLPVRTIKPDYEIALNDEDRAALGIPEGTRPEIGVDLICLALLFPAGSGLAANLAAPVVINLHNLHCVQSWADAAQGHYHLDADGRWESLC
jgi:flagellar assembly factor FliW